MQVPTDLVFHDETKREVKLGDYFGKSHRPIILTLVYYKCPMLCTMVLNELVRTMNGMDTLTAGKDFDVLSVSFDPRKTLNFGRMIEQWGTVPLVYLEGLSKVDYTYGYIGSEDLTMYPILPPSSFIQVDETKSKVSEGGWRSEYERPIYFIETRDGHTCCWCTLTREDIILQPHPLSPVAPRVFGRHEAEVLGQVVGVAMRLGEWRSVPDSAPVPKERATLN